VTSIRIPAAIEEKIGAIVFAGTMETGVTLFGRKTADGFEIVEVCGPGPDATHEEFHYSGDNDYASAFYEDLLTAQPDLKHIGEFHVHPSGMHGLSGGDRRTVEEVLKTYDEFIAGVMLRRDGKVDFYPVHFVRGKEGRKMEVLRDAGEETSRWCWLRRWWKRDRRGGS
jgi:hypothetical protein